MTSMTVMGVKMAAAAVGGTFSTWGELYKQLGGKLTVATVQSIVYKGYPGLTPVMA